MAEVSDVVLIGGGIMSATLGTLLRQLEPEWKIRVVERLDAVALESSDAWNNAGTGHAALCELNYTPQNADGSVEIAKAVDVNEQFQVSRQLWSFLVESGKLPEPSSFIHPTPHMSFVWGAENVEYLRRRYEALREHPLFVGMEYSEDRATIAAWAPALVEQRDPSEPIAATWTAAGTDVDFGSLTRHLTSAMVDGGATLDLGTEVRSVTRGDDGLWEVACRPTDGGETVVHRSRFVFVGAGGYALQLLQGSGIPEIKGFGGFPVSGQFLRTTNPELVAQHHAKVYGKAAVGAPPMSVPHLDTRVVDGEPSVMFGPYAGWSPRFLKSGSNLDLIRSVRPHNMWPMVQVGLRNLSLLVYLVKEVLAGRRKKLSELRNFVPAAQADDWELITAGQRVQVVKNVPGKGAVLQFGTEVITSADGSIAGLLGASPGASTAAPIMLTVLERCFPEQWAGWKPALEAMVPSHGERLSEDPARAHEIMTRTAESLGLALPPERVRDAVPA
ncbi:malate:quinone oxidoreductase [Nocardioides bruguierae]|uniref:Probable malate:quinone oxidoreductase n=1 Tax=Nocardioides bruguierae TaxID=2945102 RepID=A0A9X2IF23_9ACTN|nr:malate:quinone oxidoreductase [Nocardioides bruguierae]MCM0620663.1 malate:quinone oxidoreductase [Nocardioides bruguierae]